MWMKWCIEPGLTPTPIRPLPSRADSRARHALGMIGAEIGQRRWRLEKDVRGSDDSGVKFAARNAVGNAITANGHQNVVNDRDDRADGELKFVTERHINQNAEERQQRGNDGRRLISPPITAPTRCCPMALNCACGNFSASACTTFSAEPVDVVTRSVSVPPATSF